MLFVHGSLETVFPPKAEGASSACSLLTGKNITNSDMTTLNPGLQRGSRRCTVYLS